MTTKPNPFIFICTLVCALGMTTSLNAQEITFVDEYLYPEAEKRISMDFQNATLGNVLKILSQQSGMNFVASDQISDKQVNLYLNDVPVWEALERILEANSLAFEIKAGSNIFMVKEAEEPASKLITRVYQLNHATVPTHLINNTLTFDVDIGGEDGESGGTAGGAAATTTTGGEGGQDEGILSAIESVLSEDGSVVQDKRTNSLIVTDYPNQFNLIELTIARLDVRVPQILIEAEMLDISKNTADLLGAKWGDSPVEFSGGSKLDLFPFDLDNAVRDNVSPENNVPGARDGLFADPRFTASVMSFEGLQFTLQFLRTQTDTRNLARPRILTLNNQTATIAIKTDEAVGVQQETADAGGLGTSTEEAERTETGVFLKVTPMANIKTREITMAVEPKVVQARTGTIQLGGQPVKDPEERGTKSILRVTDGDTIIIGGLLRTDVTDINTKVPVISKIPIVGSAFRHKDKIETQRELIVFLTPHILKEHMARPTTNESHTIVREQNMPRSERWSELNEDLYLTENY